MEEVFAAIIKALSSVEGASVTIAIALEFIFRMFPSEKPLSIIRVIASVARKSGEILVKIADISDKILPQKIKG